MTREPAVDPAQVPPLRVDTARVLLAGTVLWAVALVVTLVVPSLHSNDRDWWPMTCAAGVVLGLLGYGYVRRGRGNAAGAHE